VNTTGDLFAAVGLDDETADAYAATVDVLANDLATLHGHDINRVRAALRAALMGEFDPMHTYITRPLVTQRPVGFNQCHLMLWRLRRIMEATVEIHGYHAWMDKS
jgi:hypothetical protein